jgi:hypothetical protein
MTRKAAFIASLAALLAACATPQPAPSPLQQGEADVKHLLMLMDRDQSGRVSRAEFTAFMAGEFARLDSNRDGALDVAELTGLEARRERVASASKLQQGEPQVVYMLRLMDRDQNGKVSQAEFMSFMGAEFARLDINHDGELDVPELTDLRIKPRKPGGGSK